VRVLERWLAASRAAQHAQKAADKDFWQRLVDGVVDDHGRDCPATKFQAGGREWGYRLAKDTGVVAEAVIDSPRRSRDVGGPA